MADERKLATRCVHASEIAAPREAEGGPGGVESLATQPVTSTHHGLTPAERSRRGITDSMIRLSVGREDPEDLIDNLEQALE